MQLRQFLSLFSLVVLLAAQGCVSPAVKSPTAVHQFEMGQPLDPSKVNQIIEGKTTEREAIFLLGTPQTIQDRPDGARILIYHHYQTQMSGPGFANIQGSISNEMLVLGIRNGVVKKKLTRSSTQPTKSFTGFTY
ncbi:MAG: hypothetical protein Q8L00_01980 [Deltaproteobacteria bacterium]|nr:hypothetical protein [Deltaproteobacteria bacterium]